MTIESSIGLTKGGLTMSNNSRALKIYGVIMFIYGILYAIVGTLAVAGLVMGVLPGQEKGEVVVILLSYIIAILAIILGVACIRGIYKTARLLGLVFGAFGLISLIYTGIAVGTFSLIDCITMVLGVGIYYLAKEN